MQATLSGGGSAQPPALCCPVRTQQWVRAGEVLYTALIPNLRLVTLGSRTAA
jgi:hypothetical protein